MRVMVAGALGQRPDRGGHAWLFLEYLLGLQELGCDVCFVDRLEPGMCHDGAGRPCAPSESVEAAHVASVMEWAGLGDRWAVLVDGGHHSLGMERGRLGAWASGADLLIDVMGYLQAPDLLAAPARRLFLDIDPGFPQWWAAQGLHDAFGRHDVYATFGTNLGRPGCAVPDTGISWTPTLPPVVLSQWPVSAAVDRGITTVGSWRGPFAPLEVDGRRFGLRAHAMRPIAGLPESCAGFGVDFSIALDVDPADTADVRLLREGGWHVLDPVSVAGSPAAYRSFVSHSAAELLVPKELYLRAGTGWFSDRSACYLTSGTPVVMLAPPGTPVPVPVGKGLVTFGPDDGPEVLGDVFADYALHTEAARALAEEHFDSARVLGALLEAAVATP